MAVKTNKRTVEVLLVSADIHGAGFQKLLLKSRNLLTVDLLWPRASIARKTAAREARFSHSKVNFTSEEWAKRILFREEVDGHTAFAVSVSENLSDEIIEKFFRLTAKYAFKTAGDLVSKYTVGISDIASAPIDALSSMAGTYPGPKTIAQGVIDVADGLLPDPGGETIISVPLHKPQGTAVVGAVNLVLRG